MKITEQRYITPDILDDRFCISKSMQAKLRMKKLIPYVRPAGSRVILYDINEIEIWLKTWEVI